MTDYKNLFDLSGKVAVVTGGGGILGRHFCAALAAHGADVAVVDVVREAAQEVSDQIAERYGRRSVAIACDVSDPGSVNDMAAEVKAALGEIDILHNNAASKSSDLEKFFAPSKDYDLETWRETMGVNLDGMFLVARTIGTDMAARGAGSIIQTASIYGVMGPDNRIYEGSEYMGMAINTPAAYSASKAGVIGLTRHFATEWGAAGVRVNTLTPGGVASGQNDAFQQKYADRVPLGRMADAKDMVGALVWLASDAAAYVTGQNIIVDGGLSAW